MYFTIGGLGGAAGREVSRRLVDSLKALDGRTGKDALHAMFCVYVVMRLINLAIVFVLGASCEVRKAVTSGYARAAESEEGMEMDLNGTIRTKIKDVPAQHPSFRVSRHRPWESSTSSGFS